MEEQEFERLLKVMESIDSKLDSLTDIESNTSPVYNASDICERLDKIIKLIENNL